MSKNEFQVKYYDKLVKPGFYNYLPVILSFGSELDEHFSDNDNILDYIIHVSGEITEEFLDYVEKIAISTTKMVTVVVEINGVYSLPRHTCYKQVNLNFVYNLRDEYTLKFISNNLKMFYVSDVINVNYSRRFFSPEYVVKFCEKNSVVNISGIDYKLDLNITVPECNFDYIYNEILMQKAFNVGLVRG